ncbi:RPL15 [Symbiodinium sp. CCMP2592]|nr:RPL15 [Symbiodinium sp. CCMP2592]
MFRGLAASPGTATRAAAEAAYVEALEYLRVRGFGVVQPALDGKLPVFLKRHYQSLPQSSREQLAQAHVPGTVFGLHIAEASCARPGADAAAFSVGLAAPDAAAPVGSLATVALAEDNTEVIGKTTSSSDSKPLNRQASAAGKRAGISAASIPDKAGKDCLSSSTPREAAEEATVRDAREQDRDEDLGATWEVIHQGPVDMCIQSYTSFREAVEQVLGLSKDAGIYDFHDLGLERGVRRLKGACRPEACKGCTQRVRAEFGFEAGRPSLKVRTRGKHGELAKPTGGSLWTVAEEVAIRRSCKDAETLTSVNVRQCLKQAGLKLRCESRQLHQWVTRQKAKLGVQTKRGPTSVRAGELQIAAAPFLLKDLGTWETLPLHKLFVLQDPAPTFNEERVCVAWTCPGMLRRARAAQGKVIKLAIDGKQSILINDYTVVTVSFLVCSEQVRPTRQGGARTGSRQNAHTLTQEPLAQTLMNTEKEANISQFLRTLENVASKCCGLDLSYQVWQVHKDYAKGIEASRINVFPCARPCDDYPHMRRASHSVLASLLSPKIPSEPQKFLEAKVTRQNSSAAEDESNARRSKPAETKPLQLLERVIQLSRFLPTVVLFDAVWQLTFSWLETVSKKAATYLKQTYFHKVPVSSLRKQMHVGQPVGKSADASCWFAGFWAGVTGTYPGTGSGTQSLESFHAYWQAQVRSKVRTAPTDIFRAMEDLYKTDWCKKFMWEEARSFLTWPDRPALDLLNSTMLRTAGRSPAADFWDQRAKKLTGLRNHFKIWRRTDKAKGQDGITTFWVMRCQRHQDQMPADASIDQSTAETFADLLTLDGTELQRLLTRCGVAEGDANKQRLNANALDKLLGVHCAVFRGHLADSLWPRVRRRLQTPLPSTLCTCIEFMQHAECEHIVFVKALEGDADAENLNEVPILRKRGRKPKRKADAEMKSASAAKRRRQQK